MSFGLSNNSTCYHTLIFKDSIKTEFGIHFNKKGDFEDKSNNTICATLSQPAITSVSFCYGAIMNSFWPNKSEMATICIFCFCFINIISSTISYIFNKI